MVERSAGADDEVRDADLDECVHAGSDLIQRADQGGLIHFFRCAAPGCS